MIRSLDFMSFWKKIFGDPNKRIIDNMRPIVERINFLEPEFEKLSDEELKNKTKEFRLLLEKEKSLDDILPEAFAACREAAKRTLGQRHFDVQLIGGVVLCRGQIAEMKTGEGKTLTATLAIYLNALEGKGAHVVTVNDYLAKRDSVWMGQIYYALGLSVACINHESAFIYDPQYQQPATGNQQPNDQGSVRDEERDTKGVFKIEQSYLRPVSRREAYQTDILYGTNNEFGFDYLRDNMVVTQEQMVQRELNFAIVDEVDSILIDEARTPLIISAPAEESGELYYRFAELVKRLKENEDYNVDEKMRAATLTEEGISKMEKWLGVENIYTEGGVKLAHHIEQALKAEVLFKKDKDYVVREGEVIIVDEFTGRLMFGRRYSEGLHQAIEAKEGVKIQRESQTLATVTFQNYFRLYKKLSGMTGTAATEAEEFSKIYNLEVVQIPTNKPMIRNDRSDKIYKTEQGKFKAAVEEIKKRHEAGQPVLVGTISIEKNEILGEMLGREGVPHNILNAKNHEREAEIIAQAGRKGAVTIATNMAGRGVDIILGGNPPIPSEAAEVKAAGGLFVLGTERHESRRIDNQLRGRSGRQGDPGESQFFVSLEDDLMRIFAGDRIKRLMETMGIPEDMPIENRIVSRSIEAAQKKVEGHNFDIRKYLLEYDDVLNKHRETIYRKRREVLKSEKDERLKKDILEMVEREIERVVLFHTALPDEKEWNLEEIYESIGTMFAIPADGRLKLDDIRSQAGGKKEDAEARTKIIVYLMALAEKEYEALEKRVAEATGNPDFIKEIEKGIILRSIDTLWVEHLEAMDALKTGIGLRGYGQRDPLVEYKKESYRMFSELLELIDKQVVYNIFKVGVVRTPTKSLLERQGVSVSAPEKGGANAATPTRFAGAPARREPGGGGGKVGRNDPCPCGSGKKYKKCCGG
jgi:preprotein translocase subunit SecA